MHQVKVTWLDSFFWKVPDVTEVKLQMQSNSVWLLFGYEFNSNSLHHILSSFHIFVEHSAEDINGIGPNSLTKKGRKKRNIFLVYYNSLGIRKAGERKESTERAKRWHDNWGKLKNQKEIRGGSKEGGKKLCRRGVQACQCTWASAVWREEEEREEEEEEEEWRRRSRAAPR